MQTLYDLAACFSVLIAVVDIVCEALSVYSGETREECAYICLGVVKSHQTSAPLVEHAVEDFVRIAYESLGIP